MIIHDCRSYRARLRRSSPKGGSLPSIFSLGASLPLALLGIIITTASTDGPHPPYPSFANGRSSALVGRPALPLFGLLLTGHPRTWDLWTVDSPDAPHYFNPQVSKPGLGVA